MIILTRVKEGKPDQQQGIPLPWVGLCNANVPEGTWVEYSDGVAKRKLLCRESIEEVQQKIGAAYRLRLRKADK